MLFSFSEIGIVHFVAHILRPTDRSDEGKEGSKITKATFLKSSWVTASVPGWAHILWSCSGRRNPKKLISASKLWFQPKPPSLWRRWHAQYVIQLCRYYHIWLAFLDLFLPMLTVTFHQLPVWEQESRKFHPVHFSYWSSGKTFLATTTLVVSFIFGAVAVVRLHRLQWCTPIKNQLEAFRLISRSGRIRRIETSSGKNYVLLVTRPVQVTWRTIPVTSVSKWTCQAMPRSFISG